MNMKRRILNLTAIAVMLLSSVSCQKDILGGICWREAKVSFNLQASELHTRAIADASNIDVLHWEIYGADVQNPSSLPLAEGAVMDSDGDGVFSLDLTLIKDQTYHFIFWAQVDREEGSEHYEVSDLRQVGIKTYEDELANDESRAAFFAYEPIHVTGTLNKTITLYRPFAQVNFGTVHYDVPSLNLSGDLKVNHSEVKVKGIATSFNTLTGMGEGRQDVLFQKNVTPHGDIDAVEKKLEVKDSRYHWLGMNYFIVSGDEDNVKVDATFHTTHGIVDLSVDNVPIRENYRTNIIGDLLTTEAVFKVVVDENFEASAIIVNN